MANNTNNDAINDTKKEKARDSHSNFSPSTDQCQTLLPNI